MCGILDSCQFHDFLDPNNEDGRAFREWAETRGSLVYPGNDRLTDVPKNVAEQVGKLAQEFSRNPKMADYFAALHDKGQAHRINLSAVAQRYPETAGAESNDRHILALALASGARLIFTSDESLMRDFKNPDIIRRPRGSVYQRKRDHEDLLRRNVCKPPPQAPRAP